jgi:hypothetical protein
MMIEIFALLLSFNGGNAQARMLLNERARARRRTQKNNVHHHHLAISFMFSRGNYCH